MVPMVVHSPFASRAKQAPLPPRAGTTAGERAARADASAAQPRCEPSKASAVASPPCRRRRSRAKRSKRCCTPLCWHRCRRASSASRLISGPTPTRAEQSKRRCPPRCRRHRRQERSASQCVSGPTPTQAKQSERRCPPPLPAPPPPTSTNAPPPTP
jgi:hypothetical protein